ncbi:MAG: type IX secretion system membrane protein PorP/SprF [Bacteroidetes bacterium]|nr:type IX secretion system membrane protein PorP/SprF [Bacteroidota bacterium]
MKNNPSVENIDQWLFESVEGMLSEDQQDQLDQFLIQNPAYLEEQLAWSEAKLESAPVEYAHVNRLLQKALWQRPLFWVSTAAIALIALLTFTGWFAYSSEPESVAKTFDIEYGQLNKEVSESKSVLALETIEKSQNLDNSAQNLKEFNSLVNSKNGFEKEKQQETTLTSTSKVQQTQTDEIKLNESVTKSIFQEKKLNPVQENSVAEGKLDILNSSKEEKQLIPATAVDQLKAEEAPIVAQIKYNLENNSTDIKKTELPKPYKGEVFVGTLGFKKAENVARVGEEESVSAFVGKPKEVRTTSHSSKSFSSQFRGFMRKLERMTDNPVALYNSKDQYFHTPKMMSLDANFAAAGDQMGPRVIANNRAQWLGETNQQIMSTLSFDTYVRSLRGGLGVQMDHSYYDKGQYNLGQVALTYSPKIGISKNWVLEPAVRLKIGNKSLTRNNLSYGDNVELDRGAVRTFLLPEDQTTSNNLWYQDVGLGLLANSKWFFVGAQIDNLAKHYNNVYSLSSLGEKNNSSIHVTTTIGTDYVSRNKNISISPYVLYQKTEKLSEIWAGTIFRYKKLTLGGAYSSIGDYAGSIGMKTNRFMLTYNADVTTSALLGKQILSHQAILRILIKNDRNGQRMLKL